MTSPRALYANRANARASTGPRTAAGKARAARNARGHGLSVPVLHDPALAPEVERLARAIAGAQAEPELYEAACRIAEAQIDLVRVRHARRALMPDGLYRPECEARLRPLEDYERRALSRRKFAIRDFDDLACGHAPRHSGRTKPFGKRPAIPRLRPPRLPVLSLARLVPGCGALLRAIRSARARPQPPSDRPRGGRPGTKAAAHLAERREVAHSLCGPTGDPEHAQSPRHPADRRRQRGHRRGAR
jgi:hypothetical protein